MEQDKQVVDPVVSKAKYDQEVSNFLAAADMHRKRGVMVLHHEFPDIKLAFCAPQIKPLSILFAVTINYTNYDLEPLSVKFIHPLTFKYLTDQEVGHPFGRLDTQSGKPQIIPLIIGRPDGTSFICLPGIREYHEHPDHSDDPWLTHRGKGGEGSLGFIVEKLLQFGISPVKSLSVNVNFVNAALTFDANKIPR